MDLKKKWAELSPARKKKAVILATVLAALIIGLTNLVLHLRRHAAAPPGVSTGKTIGMNNGLLQKSEYYDNQEQLARFKDELAGVENTVAGLKNNKEQAAAGNMQASPARVKNQSPMSRYFPPLPQAPVPEASQPAASSFPPGYPPAPGQAPGARPAMKPALQVIGGIEVVSGPPAPEKKPEEIKKKRGESVYLPPSFMEATLLTGMDALTSDVAKEGDVPVLLRIKAPAVLPNRVKADLKGCFVIAGAHGDLADERAHVRLVDLSCIARNGSAVIDQAVQGFVVDNDGKVGLRGRVVSKMGAALARSFIAGFFGGLGQATQYQTETTSISSLGTTQTIQPSKIFEAGAGQGIATAAQQLQQFYLSLAKQSIPVIEVGATRDVTLVIEKGVTLQIKNFCNQMGDDKCEN